MLPRVACCRLPTSAGGGAMELSLTRRYFSAASRHCWRHLLRHLLLLLLSGCLLLLLLLVVVSHSPSASRLALLQHQSPAPDMAALLRARPRRVRALPAAAPVQLGTPAAKAAPRHLLLSQVMRSRLGSTNMELVRPARLRRPASCPARVLIPWSGGRAGNLLFEYLTSWAVSRLHNVTLLIPDTMIETFEGVFPDLTAQRGDLDLLMMDCAHLWHRRRNVSVSDIADVWTDLAPITGWVQLVGYPCNMTRPLYQLWHAYGDAMRAELLFSAPISAIVQDYLWRVRRAVAPAGEEVTFIGLHARRTDYYEATYNLDGVWMNVPDELYFSRAVRHYQRRYPNTVFLVVSDDMPWCRQHLAALDGVVLFPGDADNPAMLDMALLAHCNHTVITYGTFALSAAIMTGGDVVVPTDIGIKWNSFERQKEFWPAEWTEISVL